jgi:hypothetical protein
MKRGIIATESEKFHMTSYEESKKFSNQVKRNVENPDNQFKILHECEKSMRERRVFKYGYCSILHYVF